MKLFLSAVVLAGAVLGGIAAANEAPPPRPSQLPPTKVTVPVVIKHADLSKEGEGVKAKLVLPAKLHRSGGVAPVPGRKVGLNESVAPTQRSIVAAIALSLAAVSIVFVVRGKKLNTTSKGAVIGVICLLSAFGAAQADLSVPGQPRRRPPEPRPEVAKSSLVVEFSDDTEGAILTLQAK